MDSLKAISMGRSLICKKGHFCTKGNFTQVEKFSSY